MGDQDKIWFDLNLIGDADFVTPSLGGGQVSLIGRYRRKPVILANDKGPPKKGGPLNLERRNSGKGEPAGLSDSKCGAPAGGIKMG
jgi:hypothetical protein